jgi:hypothetical protein
MEASERRRETRAHVSPPAQIVRVGWLEPVEVLNASYRGLFIRTDGAAPPTGELLRMRIELPAKTIDINAVAVRVIQDANGRAGVGLRFFALNGEDKRIWEGFIASLLAPRRADA